MQILQVVGYKNAGKTTLTCEIIRLLTSKGNQVGSLKHDVHHFEPDIPSKDTWQHRQAGAYVTAITSPARTAWVQERSTPIEQLVSEMEARTLDYLIIEGFKSAPYPKLVLIRKEEDLDLLKLSNIQAVCIREPNEVIEAAVVAQKLPLIIQSDTLSFAGILKVVFNS
ncbi:molybdopterin-guanine dinucleotide biosynthesis protein B [Cohnella sp. WQ 127256]|uniref:molybdopterin-guanine dinucleotide biosynthesis protein B n=1 Tax=Cohnella sp. WQ 127256 TaxID=2938790 RepID=UPI0021196923